ncbi:EscU/YscU/HrcU family type III secretion system export apparatus switch protein [Bradyrhizobium centrolobii]|uniref:Translocation protein n=2 Tax=Bradyrhizobium TaxID=374 RepID=A0A176YZ44_9BRAD|nr:MULTISPECIES: EscU/YscU/HrcU family type III secretion system export apparatus switch protein [Bradyrhizobium]OAF03752.1 EscU/YscU/HrcU family type III secretion system export apparatus switch protein [Bradyrhizobium centrolobii]OAF12489.1 translocation protein [Bradyrhizobium neotropicale]
MNETTEEKELPPTPKKLRDARKKGQSPRTADFVSAVSACVGLGCLWLRAGLIKDEWHQAIRLVDKLQRQPFHIAVERALGGLIELAVATVGPFLGTTVGAAILAGFLANGGLTFSFEPLKPNLEKMDPIKGLKRIATMRSLIELGKTLVKIFVLGASLLLTIIGSWKALVHLPACGMDCFGVVFTEVKLLIGIAVGAFLIGGLTDLLIQRWLFLRDMRMTKTEAKRESKEMQGNPEVKREHRRLREQAANEPPLGIHRATLILVGQAMLVGLRYVRGETGVPVLVCRGEGEAASVLLAKARTLRLCIVQDHVLTRQLIHNAKLGNAVPAQHFEAVARALYTTGLA